MESKLSHLFGLINLSESDYQKNIVKKFIEELWDNTLINIMTKRDRPDFDHVMYLYQEQNFKMVRHFECVGAVNQSILFNVELSWKYDSYKEEYTDQEAHIMTVFLNFLGMSFKVTDYLPQEKVNEDLINLANGIAVENWTLKGVPQP
jgi:hypothetical protein